MMDEKIFEKAREVLAGLENDPDRPVHSIQWPLADTLQRIEQGYNEERAIDIVVEEADLSKQEELFLRKVLKLIKEEAANA